MYLSNPVKNSGVVKYISYSLSGSAITDSIVRRFSDFFALREKLVERWPGIYIPNVPPKKSIGNLENQYIDARMRLLNEFCLRLSKFPFLFESEEVKLFQTTTSDVTKALDKLPKLKYQDILEKYKVAFPDFSEGYDLILGQTKAKELLMFLKKTLKNIKTFREMVADVEKKTTSEISKYLELLHQFEEHEKYVLLEYADNDESKLVFFNPKNTELTDKIERLKETLKNPYGPLNNWLEEEEIDIEAMIEALGSLQTLSETREKLSHKIDSIENDIKQLKFGKQSFVSGLFQKKENKIAELEKEKVTAEENIQFLEKITKYSHYNMENYEEVYKKEKIKEYYKYLRMFAVIKRNNNKIIDDLWENVKKDMNPLKQ